MNLFLCIYTWSCGLLVVFLACSVFSPFAPRIGRASPPRCHAEAHSQMSLPFAFTPADMPPLTCLPEDDDVGADEPTCTLYPTCGFLAPYRALIFSLRFRFNVAKEMATWLEISYELIKGGGRRSRSTPRPQQRQGRLVFGFPRLCHSPLLLLAILCQVGQPLLLGFCLGRLLLGRLRRVLALQLGRFRRGRLLLRRLGSRCRIGTREVERHGRRRGTTAVAGAQRGKSVGRCQRGLCG